MPRWPGTVLTFALLLVPQFHDEAHAQPAPAQPRAAGAQPATGTILLTVFLKHDQSKTLGEINEQLFRNGYYDKFPPDGIEVVSWYVVMGIGQVVTLRTYALLHVTMQNTSSRIFAPLSAQPQFAVNSIAAVTSGTVLGGCSADSSRGDPLTFLSIPPRPTCIRAFSSP